MNHPSLKYRATLVDGDTARERPLTVHGNSLEEIERWAGVVLAKALDGATVQVYELQEVPVKSIPKPEAE